MSLGSERKTVQNPLIRYASEVGWTVVDRDEVLRLRRRAGCLLVTARVSGNKAQ